MVAGLSQGIGRHWVAVVGVPTYFGGQQWLAPSPAVLHELRRLPVQTLFETVLEKGHGRHPVKTMKIVMDGVNVDVGVDVHTACNEVQNGKVAGMNGLDTRQTDLLRIKSRFFRDYSGLPRG